MGLWVEIRSPTNEENRNYDIVILSFTPLSTISCAIRTSQGGGRAGCARYHKYVIR